MDRQIDAIKRWLGSGSINIFGPPFSGKDTQGRKLAELLGGTLIAGGDILRHAQDDARIQDIMAKGGIVPSELFLQIIPPFFARPELAGKPLFLSSIGRLMSETPTVIQAAHDSGHDIRAAILLQLPEQDVWRHFHLAQQLQDRGTRPDDTPEILKTRLHEFSKTTPVIDHYRSLGLLIEIDDTKDPDQVSQEILTALANRSYS